MPPPALNTPVTPAQIAAALNVGFFNGANPNRNWHQGPNGGGLFEPWSLQFGYAAGQNGYNQQTQGFPIYGGVVFNGRNVHIYYLYNATFNGVVHKNGAFVILDQGQTPQSYGITP